jgi:hypothetical protein
MSSSAVLGAKDGCVFVSHLISSSTAISASAARSSAAVARQPLPRTRSPPRYPITSVSSKYECKRINGEAHGCTKTLCGCTASAPALIPGISGAVWSSRSFAASVSAAACAVAAVVAFVVALRFTPGREPACVGALCEDKLPPNSTTEGRGANRKGGAALRLWRQRSRPRRRRQTPPRRSSWACGAFNHTANPGRRSQPLCFLFCVWPLSRSKRPGARSTMLSG